MVRMATELVLLGTAGAPAPVAGRAGISSALAVDGRVFVVDCGRGTPSGYADAGLDFARLTGIFITHLHADHIGDLAGMLLYPWGLRAGPDGPLPPVQVYGPGRPAKLPEGDAAFGRQHDKCCDFVPVGVGADDHLLEPRANFRALRHILGVLDQHNHFALRAAFDRKLAFNASG